jgi:2,4-dienoyl-CoA reductase-like NADH-dependent reductase (Old Yellow Enzyme family)
MRETTADPSLFSPFTLRGIQFANRIVVSPMCEYSSFDGFANDWHMVHLGSRAVGGAALVITEATAVTADGRITDGDLGIYKDEHIEPLRRITKFIKGQGSVAGMQLAHAGRKASTAAPWDGGAVIAPGNPGGWQVAGPSAVPFQAGDPIPRELTTAEISEIVQAFVAGAKRAVAAGFEVLEIHGAHGYLAHEFLSPLSNHRTDQYGGSFENRIRFTIELVTAIRAAIGDQLPLFLRISATDWTEGGWTIEDSIELARRVKPLGVDLIDVSSGGNVVGAKIPLGPGYQVPFAERIRTEVEIPTGSVGMITTPQQADEIIRSGQADLTFLAREFLRDPFFPMHAAVALGVHPQTPKQYLRAFPNSVRRAEPSAQEPGR